MGDWTDLLQRPGQSDGTADFLLNALNSASNRRAQDVQTQIAQGQLSQQQQAASREQQFQQAWANYTRNPTPQSLINLQGQFPEKAQALNQIWKAKDSAARTADLGYLGGVYSAFQNKRPDLALSAMRQRRDADAAAGLDTSVDDDWIKAVESGDQNAIKYVQGAVLAHIGAADPDSFSKNYGVVDKSKPFESKVVGRSVGHYDENGVWHTDYTDPQDFTLSPGEQRFPGQPGGGGQASGGGGGAPAPLVSNGVQYAPAGRTQYGWTPWQGNGGDNSTQAYINKIDGMSKALGVGPNDDISKLPPKQIYEALTLSEGGKPGNRGNLRNPDGSFKNYGSQAAGDNAGIAQVVRNLKRGQTTIATMVGGLPVGGAPQSGPTPIASVPATPKPQYQMLTPQETQALGLDPNVRYQRAPDGQITALGGQSKAQLKQWPQTAAKAYTDNQASIANIDRALSLFDPNNKSKDAQAARGAVGYGTGALGDNWTNYWDPNGTAARALVGQIGGIIIKDMSGAAVSASEDARLNKWVPKVTDAPATIRTKLQNLRSELAQKQSAMESYFSQDQGYRPLGESASGAPANLPRMRSLQQARSLPPGTHFIDPNGIERVR